MTLLKSSVGTARKVSPNWLQETMTYHSSNCFSIVWGQGNAPLVRFECLIWCHVIEELASVSSHESHWRTCLGRMKNGDELNNLAVHQ